MSKKKNQQLLKQKHPDADFVFEMDTPLSDASIYYTVLTQTGYATYRLTGKQSFVQEDSLNWADVQTAKVDRLFLKSDFVFNDDHIFSLLTDDSDKHHIKYYIEQRINQDIPVKERKWYQKVVGFRSKSPWKMVTATLIYIFMLSTLMALFSDNSIWSMLFSLITFILTGALISSVIALFRGHFNLVHIPDKRTAAIILGISVVLIGVLPNTAAENESQVSDTNEAAENQELDDDQVNQANQQTQDSPSDSNKSNASNNELPSESDNQTTKQHKENNKNETNQNESTDNHDAESNQSQTDDNSHSSSSSKTTTQQNTSNENRNKANDSQSTTTRGDVTAQVTRVVDGDTIEVNLHGSTEKVRLLLVDTPETVAPSEPVQPYGPQANNFTKKKLSGEQVRLEYDGSKRGKYDRLLAYVWIDGNNFNKMLLKQGLARYAYVYNPPYTYSDSFIKARNRAKRANRRIWSRNNYVANDGFNDQKQSSDSQSSAPSESGSANQAPESDNESQSTDTNTGGLKYDPNGPDRDCGDFDTHDEAQAFYKAAGGPDKDPHRLDREGDGSACESLPAG